MWPQPGWMVVLAVVWLVGCPTPRMPCNQDADCDPVRHVCDVSQPQGRAAGTCVGRWLPRTPPGVGGSSSLAVATSHAPVTSHAVASASTSIGRSSAGSSSVGGGTGSGGSTNWDSSTAVTSGYSHGSTRSHGSSGEGSSSVASGAAISGSMTACSGCVLGDGGCAQPVGVTACGAVGAACVDCTVVGDACLGDGGCGCGTGPACDQGFVCLGGACTCDARTCPTGCCNANGCRPGTRKQACGAAGLACDNCGGSNRCEGQICPELCTAANCATGCCSGSTCITAPDVYACATGGLLCLACDTTLADGCTAGACTCGGAAACLAPDVCRNGSCGPP